MFSYTDMENVSEPKIIIFVFVKIPPNFALPSADYQICALKKHQNVPDNMLTKPQICCGCCAYPGLLLAVLAVSSNKLDFYFPHNGPTGQAGPRQNHCNTFFLGSAWRFS